MTKIKVTKANTLAFKSGTSITFTDPCYVFDYKQKDYDEAWSDMCNQMFKEGTKDEGLLEVHLDDGTVVNILFTGTRHGDGYYGVDSIPGRFGVDAGLICVLATADMLKINDRDIRDISSQTTVLDDDAVFTAEDFGIHDHSRRYNLVT